LAKRKKSVKKPLKAGRAASRRPPRRRPAAKVAQEAEGRAFALMAARLAAERRCKDIVVLDLRGKSPATDYFVIATGTSDRQMRTVADEICREAKKKRVQLFGRAGFEQARWILLDFVDVVIHLFDSEYRDYYDLDLLWGDAEKLIIDD
jgi:ribosome-associated protein